MFHNRLLRLFVAMTAVLLLIGGRTASVARAAQLAQTDATPVMPGLYESEVMTAADSSEIQISLLLASDGSIMAMTDHMDGEPAFMEMGEWANNGDDTVTVSITGDESGDYDEPVVIDFAVDGDTLTADNEELFGDTPLVLTLFASEEELAGETMEDSTEMDESEPIEIPGVYATMPMDTGNGPGVVIFNLAEDGSAQAFVSAFDGESLPLTRLGEWVDNGDNTVTVTMTQELAPGESADVGVAVDLDEVEPLTFEVGDDGSLVSEQFTAYSLTTLGVEAEDDSETSDVSAEDADVEVYVSDVMPSADSEGRVVALSLVADGAAAMATSYMNDEPTVVELGEWMDNEDGTITVSLLGTEDQVYDEPVVITFELTDDGLTATEYDEELYGEDGLVLTLQSADDDSDAESSESAMLVLETAADAPILAHMEAYEDGSLSMVIDFQDGDGAEEAIGTWENNDDGTVTVALTGDGSAEFDEPVVLVFEIGDDDSLTAVEWDTEIFGEDALVLMAVEE